jgi:hypothetical protein
MNPNIGDPPMEISYGDQDKTIAIDLAGRIGERCANQIAHVQLWGRFERRIRERNAKVCHALFKSSCLLRDTLTIKISDVNPKAH